jgi:hypothetical protein
MSSSTPPCASLSERRQQKAEHTAVTTAQMGTVGACVAQVSLWAPFSAVQLTLRRTLSKRSTQFISFLLSAEAPSFARAQSAAIGHNGARLVRSGVSLERVCLVRSDPTLRSYFWRTLAAAHHGTDGDKRYMGAVYTRLSTGEPLRRDNTKQPLAEPIQIGLSAARGLTDFPMSSGAMTGRATL